MDRKETCADERRYSTTEIARIFGVCRQQVYKWRMLGVLEMSKPGKSWVATETALLDLIEKSKGKRFASKAECITLLSKHGGHPLA